eukprot:1093299-Ditylum_brightwellii.AAC.1
MVCLLIGVNDEWDPQVFKVDCAGQYLPFYATEAVNFLEKKVDDMKGYDLDQIVRAFQCLYQGGIT